MNNEYIMRMIKLFCKDELDIQKDISIRDNLSDVGIDSIGYMMLVVFIEEEFHIEIDDMISEDEQSITFENLVEYIIKKSGGEDGAAVDSLR